MAHGIAKVTSTCKVCGLPMEAAVSMIKWAPSEKGSARHFECFGQVDRFNSRGELLGAETTPATEQPKPIAGDFMAGFAQAMLPHIESKINTKLDASQVAAMVKAELAKQSHTIVIENRITGETKEIKGTHKLFAKVLYLLQKGYNPLLVGEPGSGKSHIGQQLAEALSLGFYEVALNQFSSPSVLFGFVDAMGKFQETSFYKAYKHGGIMQFEEIDNANGNLLTSLNTALANGYLTFPNGEQVTKHENFRAMGTANTAGFGGTVGYAGRQPMDLATRERFKVVEFGIDEQFETTRAIALNPEKGERWAAWVQAVRKFGKSANLKQLVASPRATYDGAVLLGEDVLTVAEVADYNLFKMIDSDTKAKVLANCPLPRF